MHAAAAGCYAAEHILQFAACLQRRHLCSLQLTCSTDHQQQQPCSHHTLAPCPARRSLQCSDIVGSSCLFGGGSYSVQSIQREQQHQQKCSMWLQQASSCVSSGAAMLPACHGAAAAAPPCLAASLPASSCACLLGCSLLQLVGLMPGAGGSACCWSLALAVVMRLLLLLESMM